MELLLKVDSISQETKAIMEDEDMDTINSTLDEVAMVLKKSADPLPI